MFAVRSAAREIGHGENSFVAQILQNHRIPHAQKIADVNRPADAHRRLVNDLGLPRNKRRLQDAPHAFQLESATRIANVINSLTPDALSEECTRLLSQSLGKVGIAYEQTNQISDIDQPLWIIGGAQVELPLQPNAEEHDDWTTYYKWLDI